MDEHRWKVGAEGEAVADRRGIKYRQAPIYVSDYIVGGTICNEEILRLAEELERMYAVDRLNCEADLPGRIRELMAENALLRRERALLIELEKVRCQIISYVAEGRPIASPVFRKVGELNDAMAALHLEASGGIQRPEGVPCACVLCRPEGSLTEPEIDAWERAERAAYQEGAMARADEVVARRRGEHGGEG